ncbi:MULTISPECIES: TIGR03752 family integrating conjugative element protein [Photobacterium]|uniref:TIGR03752 family integrating conjugative element protein n=1 Tax=Photobacterium carnosum TaxID=2023717 RepID=A0A2N4UPV0_9GAMM|nr:MULTISPECIES: TIGR03752 family integrating conjugative element protein [Photobacterium]MBY3789420.1 TIGR03752 family integrating conjugative element protein [Photobacterium carnosum]MCD9463314.1 TIGR03752 family integrating conjugative element protein [Photobacterium phosphoreum]MCD9480696.1 TIGR03752 family integrating conjugative element protein [Photobacterium phosphoreum]MCD9502109.1 TIGR03752 family integrating conjugative element protein [Photobacterium phosphoreum]MCD9512280.1 TIGR03
MKLSPLTVAIGAALVVTAVIAVMPSGESSKNVTVQAAAPDLPTKKAGGLETTSEEQVATLVAISKAQNEKLANLEDANRQLTSELDNVKRGGNNKTNTDDIVNSVLNKINATGALDVDDAVNNKLLDMENQLRDFTNRTHVEQPSYIDDYGVDTSSNLGNGNINAGTVAGNADNGYQLTESQSLNGWTLPSDAELKAENNNKEPTAVFALDKKDVFKRNTGNRLYQPKVIEKTEDGKEIDHVTKFGTIPQDSTLMGAVTMTALLGRVPVKGKLIDPFEFKVLVGADNLASNGIYIPNLKSMVLSGVAKGNYTGQCVSGDIVSGTYTFNDGRVQSFNASNLDQEGGNNSTSYEAAGQVSQDRVGWISTDNGIPCISGKYISDAASFISLQGGLAAIGGVASGFAAAAQEVTGTGDNRNAVITDPTKYALGTGGDAAVKSMNAWIEDIRQTAFAMVYVKPNVKISIHITKQIPIDYHSQARKVSYVKDWNTHANKTLD